MEANASLWRMLLQVKALIWTAWCMVAVLITGTQLSPWLSASCGGCFVQADHTVADASESLADSGCCPLSGLTQEQTPRKDDRKSPEGPDEPCEPGDCECPMPCCGLAKTVMVSIVGGGRGWVPMPSSSEPMPQYTAVSTDHSDEIVHPPRA